MITDPKVGDVVYLDQSKSGWIVTGTKNSQDGHVRMILKSMDERYAPRGAKPRLPDSAMVDIRFGRLLVLYRTEADWWMCLCKCRKFAKIHGPKLRNGHSKSCGCLKVERIIKPGKSRGIHGLSRTSEYCSWLQMKGRCYNKDFPNYHNYGGRGITICQRWLASFENFLQDVGTKPSSTHTIDRIDNNGNYEPGNCKWSTKTEQVLNNRRTVMATIGGVTKPLYQWAIERGLNPHVVRGRVQNYGFTAEEALSIPPGPGGYKRKFYYARKAREAQAARIDTTGNSGS